MENRPDTSVVGGEDSMAMVPVDQGELGKNYNDIMDRRLKNRERQRRYRERKRLEADTKKAENANISVPPQRLVQVNRAINGDENRILCRRNWKQDARMAHVVKQQEIVANGTFNESQGKLFQCENILGNSVNEDDGERRNVPGRRHWKADARNKKV